MTDSHTILYDGACGFCQRAVAWVRDRDRTGAFTAIPYQAAASPPMTPALAAACARAVHVVRADGRILRGGRAVLFILGSTGHATLARVLGWPPMVWGVDLGYRLVARNRSWFARFLFTPRA